MTIFPEKIILKKHKTHLTLHQLLITKEWSNVTVQSTKNVN